MVFCAISGEPPQDPVVSLKSGNVYERRLIQKYITDNGTDPVTGEKLEEADLFPIKASTFPVLLFCSSIASSCVRNMSYSSLLDFGTDDWLQIQTLHPQDPQLIRPSQRLSIPCKMNGMPLFWKCTH
jgi:hypothetical protein